MKVLSKTRLLFFFHDLEDPLAESDFARCRSTLVQPGVRFTCYLHLLIERQVAVVDLQT